MAPRLDFVIMVIYLPYKYDKIAYQVTDSQNNRTQYMHENNLCQVIHK